MIQHGFNIDDFLLLKLLLEKNTVHGIARIMRVSQPAISLRLRSIGDRLLIKVHRRQGRTVVLTEKGLKLATVASQIISLLLSLEIEADDADDEAPVMPPKTIVPAPPPPPKKKPETPFKISGRSLCFTYMQKK